MLAPGIRCPADGSLVADVDEGTRKSCAVSAGRPATTWAAWSTPFDLQAETGPLISAARLEKVEKHVETALAEGAVLRTGGKRRAGPDRHPARTAGSYATRRWRSPHRARR
ncbi:aldehyde dehydrogenase family protein [Amycolatopsis sp.]|uniref:aldehyde dehydrogenase family protein n=1 Tax=Amycolatopsis sp. TaxID=37632 RepID=UPI0039C867A0